MLTTAGIMTTGAGALVYTLNESVKAADLMLHAPSYPWPHNSVIGSIDMNRCVRCVCEADTHSFILSALEEDTLFISKFVRPVIA